MQQSRRLCAAASPLHRARAGDARNRRVQPQRTRGDANRLPNAAAGLRLFLYDARCRVGARMIVPKRSRSMTQDSPFTCALDVRASLGECPLWAADERLLYWIDINAPTLNRFDPATGENRVMPMPASIGSFALRERGGFVVALLSGIWLASTKGQFERSVAEPQYKTSHHRFIDGRCDPQGRFVVGSMNETRDADSGALYRLDADFTLTRLFGNMTISNGLAFSPDGTTMYHADTPARIVRAYDYDGGAGLPANGRTFVQWHGETARP